MKKRKRIDGVVNYIGNSICEEVPEETRDLLKKHVTPSQILYNIANFIKSHDGDVENSLKYIRGFYRASKKVSFFLKNKQFDIIPKVIERYLKI